MKIKDQIKYEDFQKLDIRVGTIVLVQEITNSEKLWRLQVDFGELGKKQILSGIKKWYSAEELTGLQALFVVNLEPRQMMGLVSEGMILAVDCGDESKPVLIGPKELMLNGLAVR